MRSDLLLRLPPPTALLLIASLLDIGAARILPIVPRETKTIDYRELHVVPFPAIPTAAPPSNRRALRELLRRDLNTICGYIGGDPNLPATCSAGSHCVLDVDHGAVGCCPDGQPTCTTGVFTGCVDRNSGAQGPPNPYVFTCGGSDVCYKNVFDGGFSQFGCGTDSNLATTVQASATGLTSALSLTSVSLSFSVTPTSTATSQTTSSATSSSQTSSTTSSSTTSSSSSTSSSTSSTSSATSESSSSTGLPTSTGSAAPPQGSNVDRTGAIIGGSVSGVAILIALVAVAFYLWRRKQGNVRDGPGGGSSEYISPMSGGAQFQPLYTSQEGYETGAAPHGTSTHIQGGDNGLYPGQPPTAENSYYNNGPYGSYAAAGAIPLAAGAGAYAHHRSGSGQFEGDQVPLTRETREIDDFSHSFHAALERIGEEDAADLADQPIHRDGNVNGNMSSYGASANNPAVAEQPSSPVEGGDRPLWQQNRRQSRNLMWM